MKTLVILAFLGVAAAAPFLQDTPEVVAERARFQQLYNAAAAAAAAAPDPVPSAAPHQASFQHAPAVPAASVWTGPVAATIPAGLPGAGANVADTADVAAARDAFLAAYRAQVAATTAVHHHQPAVRHHQPAAAPLRHANAIPAATQKWTGPVAATVPAGVNGQLTPVADTADVAAARTAFLNAYNAAVRATAPRAAAVHQAPVMAVQAAPRWTGPVAATIPAGLPGAGSQVADTADVAAATAAFHQAYSAALAATVG